MKKTTGKVVSLVLALALVVTSFSGTFAFASTKSVTGTVSKTTNDSIYLANGNAVKDSAVNLQSWIGAELDTKDHQEGNIGTVSIDAISHSSGSTLVQSTVADGDATLKLKSTTNSGTEVLSVLYEATYVNSDGDDVIVKARKDFTVNVLDVDSVVIGKSYVGKDLTDRVGLSIEAPATFAQTLNSTQEIGIYTVTAAATTGLATYTDVTGLTKTTTGIAGTNYNIAVTGDVNLPSDLGTSPVTLTVGRNTSTPPLNGSVGNVTVTVKKFATADTVSTDSADKYTLKTKIEKKVDVSALLGTHTTDFVISKTSGITNLTSGALTAVVTDAELVFPAGTTSVSVDSGSVKKISGTVGALTIDAATVGSVDVTATSIDVTDPTSKVGDITTENADAASVTVSEGKVGNIDTTSAAASVTTVKVNAGTVGTITANAIVTIEATDSDNAITTGKVTAPEVTVNANSAKVTVAGIKTSAAGAVTVQGVDYAVSVGTVDFDYRASTLALGDSDDNAFTGTVTAPVNAANGTITTDNADTVATVTGTVNVNTITVGSDTSLKFTDGITVDSIDGDGNLTIAAGKLYVTGGVSGTTLKLSDASLAVGTTVFKSATDTVSADDFTPYGFTLVQSAGTSVDTFKIATLALAGVQINKATSQIAVGYSETFTATAYPGGTVLPIGSTIGWNVDGSDAVFTVTTVGNTATVKVISIDPSFASENKATLTATLYDADGYVLDDYDTASVAVTAIAVPAYVSDTTYNFSVAAGASYQFKITSATAPVFTLGTGGVFTTVLASHTGNDYFYKITATGKVGSATGVFINGNKLLVATVKANFTSDTHGNVTVKGAYTVKITATATPKTFALGTAGVFKAAFVSKTGNDYLYKITSASAVGTKAGIYVNGALAFVGIVG